MNWRDKEGAIWVEAISLSSLAPSAPQRVLLSPALPGWRKQDDLEVFIISKGAGTPLVLSSRCTHEGCPVDWKEGRFACPCHGSVYDPEGKVLEGPARKPLPRPQAMVDGDTLWVRVKERKP